MAGADYDGIEGIFRILKAGQRPQTFAIEVLTFHAAIEYELEVVLRKLMPHPDMLLRGKPKLGFPHKGKLLCALWKKDPRDAEALNGVLRAFEDLRNEVAHPSDGSLKSHKARLTQAFRAIKPDTGDDPSMLEIAQGISLFIADNPHTGEQWTEALARFSALAVDSRVSDTWNQFLGE